MQNDYQPGEDLTITIAHIKHNIKVLAVIHKKAQALLDKPIEALYAMTDAFEEGEPVNMPMNLKAVTRIQKVDAILRYRRGRSIAVGFHRDTMMDSSAVDSRYIKTPFFSVWLQELLLQVTIPHILRGVGVFLVLSLTPGIPIRHR